MTEKEEFQPQWGNTKQVTPGEFIWTVYVKSCVFKEGVSGGESKPYMVIEVIVEDPPDGPEEPFNGTVFDFRVYLNPKSAWKCLWFLKKFDYPTQLLADENRPIIRKKEVVGLHGKVLVKIEQTDSGYLNFYANGFDHVGGTDLEQRQQKKNGAQQPSDTRTIDTVEAPENFIDLEQDVKSDPIIEATNNALDDL